MYQGRYDVTCRDYIAGVYSDSDLDDDEYDNPPNTSGYGKSSHPIKTDVFKIDATLFCR